VVNCINERCKAEARDQIANQSSHGAVPWIAAATGTQSMVYSRTVRSVGSCSCSFVLLSNIQRQPTGLVPAAFKHPSCPDARGLLCEGGSGSGVRGPLID